MPKFFNLDRFRDKVFSEDDFYDIYDNKIFVVGYAGAGKTSYAKGLAKRLGIKAYGTDKIGTKLKGRNLTKEEHKTAYRNELKKITSRKEPMVIEGCGSLKYLPGIDTYPLVILDTPYLISSYRAAKRCYPEKLSKRIVCFGALLIYNIRIFFIIRELESVLRLWNRLSSQYNFELTKS